MALQASREGLSEQLLTSLPFPSPNTASRVLAPKATEVLGRPHCPLGSASWQAFTPGVHRGDTSDNPFLV